MAEQKIVASSTAEYFSKNLQQVGFSSSIKAVLTVIKEAVDNSLDACEEAGILPDLFVLVEKMGPGSHKGSDQIKVRVEDNGPGIDPNDVSKVFGEYLSSSKFGRGRCSRGQQGIGISAATTWSQLTSATGATVITKRKKAPKALKCVVEVDIKTNRGILKNKEMIDWDRPHGTSVEFVFDGKVQVNGEIGVLNYLNGTTLVNPHMRLKYKLPDMVTKTVERVSDTAPAVPDAIEPHPHTMKLGEFIAHSYMFGSMKTSDWLKKSFSRMRDKEVKQLNSTKGCKGLMNKNVKDLNEAETKELFKVIQNLKLAPPPTSSVMSIGEEAFSKSINRLGSVDFFTVVSRKPTVCDFKPVLVEVGIARLTDATIDNSAQVLRFANRVPLQFDKSSCAIVKAIETVNWKAYGLSQSKNSIPLGPYVMAVSVISPFIKFENASKETIDASDELVSEIRLTLIQAGQKLSKHIKREAKANELEQKMRHIEQFCPILIDGLCEITKASAAKRKAAEDGLGRVLGRDAKSTRQELKQAEQKLNKAVERGDLRQKSDGLDDLISSI